MPAYAERNYFEASRPLPDFYWGAPTRMNCLAQTVKQTKENAYSHHIQRLMVTGNFALLAGIDPQAVHEWYLAVYADAFEWVEMPNTLGMALFADGGSVGTKPYAASGAYINKMSDYCKGCAYDVKQKNGADACPFNYLYWHFLMTQRARLSNNPRMGLVLKQLDRMDPERSAAIQTDATRFLARLHEGQV